jgi:hypothetical protein
MLYTETIQPTQPAKSRQAAIGPAQAIAMEFFVSSLL